MALYKSMYISTYSAVLRGSLLVVLLSLSLRSVCDLINEYSSSFICVTHRRVFDAAHP